MYGGAGCREKEGDAVGAASCLYRKYGGVIIWKRRKSWQFFSREQDIIRTSLPLYLTENGNHSLETGNVVEDIDILRGIMETTEEYLEL